MYVTHKRMKEIGIELWTRLITDKVDMGKTTTLKEMLADGKIDKSELALLETYNECPLCTYYRYRRCSECPLHSCAYPDTLFSLWWEARKIEDVESRNYYAQQILDKIKEWKI